jgi:L-ascorbate metabolism protein UlaG (beta-lactamase superfamily)
VIVATDVFRTSQPSRPKRPAKNVGMELWTSTIIERSGSQCVHSGDGDSTDTR